MQEKYDEDIFDAWSECASTVVYVFYIIITFIQKEHILLMHTHSYHAHAKKLQNDRVTRFIRDI